MNEGAPPQRVRVTGPSRRRTPRSRVGDIDADTQLGMVYLRSLLREQLRLALRVIGLLGLTVGSLPLLFYVAPGLSRIDVLGMPVAWLVLGVLVYPWLILLGWRFVLSAERNERDFADLMSEMSDVER